MAPRCTQLPQQPGGEHQRGAPRLCPRSQPGPEICLFQSMQGLATGCRGSFLVFLSAMRGWGAAAWGGMQRGSGEAGKRGAGGHRGVPGDPGSAGSVQIAPEGHSGGGRGAASRRPGAGSGPCPAGPRRARGSAQGFFPLHCIVKLACGNLTCSLCWSSDTIRSCTFVFPTSRELARRIDRKMWDSLTGLPMPGQAGCAVGGAVEVLEVLFGLWVESVAGEEGSVPVVAPGLWGDAWVSGDVPVARVEVPGLVPSVVPSSWLGVGVLPDTSVLVWEGAVVS